MPWVVGIDEAGYGPNLGPLVQAAVPFHLPESDHAGWETLGLLVRRCGDECDHRLLIDDSKAVYTRHGLAALERGVWGSLALSPNPFLAFLRAIALPTDAIEIGFDPWFDGSEHLPGESGEHRASRVSLPAASPLTHVVSPVAFNRTCDEYGSKAVVLSRGLVELMPAVLDTLPAGGEPILFLCDKHGGRNFYGAMLQEAFPEGWIIPELESADESRYRVELLPRPISVVFRPQADGDSIAVALASMLCKYLREVCMRQFNRFWATHVPGIKPTAGYPGDAKRFYDEIRPAMTALGLTEDQVWRKR